MRSVGILGFGQFGQLAASMLRGADVRVFDLADKTDIAAGIGARQTDFETVARSNVVVFAMPVQQMERSIADAAQHMQRGAWAIDVASVKVLPAQWMLQYLPSDVAITATHPLFGPQSAKQGLAGRKLVICPVRGRHHLALRRLAQRYGLHAITSDPDSHDREMAHVQALTHMIGRSMIRIGRPPLQLTTKSYDHLLELCTLIENDTEQLFEAIEAWNPYSKPVVDQFERALQDLRKSVKH